MKFSVIIPVYNAEKTIERVLASLVSNREYIDEVILVNDRSEDDTFFYIENFKPFFDIKVIDNAGKQGPGPARKTGLLAAESEWITFVDADDCLTPNSLYYVSREIEENEDIVLLHSQSIYYESGSFTPDTIDQDETSCGGNFYKREFLIENQLFPHDDLYMAEDEYFNEIILIFIDNYFNEENVIHYFDYPVYEVHHDIDRELSFAFSHWTDYLCKYHLLYKSYVIDFFKDIEIKKSLEEDFKNNFIFAYFLLQGLVQDIENSFIQTNELIHFQNALKFYKKTYNKNEDNIISYYEENPQLVKSLHKSAISSAGFRFKEIYNFKKFVEKIMNLTF